MGSSHTSPCGEMPPCTCLARQAQPLDPGPAQPLDWSIVYGVFGLDPHSTAAQLQDQVAQGQDAQGQDSQDQATQSREAQDQDAQGEAAQGQAAQYQAAQSQAAQGQDAQDQATQDQAAQGQAAQGQAARDQAAQGQDAQGQATQGQAAKDPRRIAQGPPKPPTKKPPPTRTLPAETKPPTKNPAQGAKKPPPPPFFDDFGHPVELSPPKKTAPPEPTGPQGVQGPPKKHAPQQALEGHQGPKAIRGRVPQPHWMQQPLQGPPPRPQGPLPESPRPRSSEGHPGSPESGHPGSSADGVGVGAQSVSTLRPLQGSAELRGGLSDSSEESPTNFSLAGPKLPDPPSSKHPSPDLPNSLQASPVPCRTLVEAKRCIQMGRPFAMVDGPWSKYVGLSTSPPRQEPPPQEAPQDPTVPPPLPNRPHLLPRLDPDRKWPPPDHLIPDPKRFPGGPPKRF